MEDLEIWGLVPMELYNWENVSKHNKLLRLKKYIKK
jgi:hypothetical protein